MTKCYEQITLQELAKITAATLHGDSSLLITGVADLETADSKDASFLANPRYTSLLKTTKAGVVFINEYSPSLPPLNYLVHPDPSKAFQKTLELLIEPTQISAFEGIHPTAVIHKSAKIGENVQIGPHAVIDATASVGSHSFVGANSYIAQGSSIGEYCKIHPLVMIRENCSIGDRVIIQSGAIIGSCGFGYTTDTKGIHSKLQQVGNVVLEDDVEIGANTTIDRGRFKSTVIAQGTKIDNLVQIAHGAKIGKHCFIIAQSGLSGSCQIGNHVVLAGQTAVIGHIKICDGAQLAGKSVFCKSITKAGAYRGVPAMPMRDWNRQQVQLRNVEKLIIRVEKLEKHLSSS